MTHTATASRAPRTWDFLRRSAFAFLLVVAASASAAAQSTGIKPPNQEAGAPAGSYALSGFENVDLFSGNLNFHLPLSEVGGRGGLKMPVMLSIDSTRWRLRRGQSGTNSGDDVGRQQGSSPIVMTTTDVGNSFYITNGSGVTYKITDTFSSTMIIDGGIWQATTDPQPIYYWVDPDGFQGAKPGYGPGVLQARTVSEGGKDYAGTRANTPGKTLTTVVFTAPDGTEYALYDKDSMGQPAGYDAVPVGQELPPHARGTVFVSTDGSAATFVSDAPVLEYFSYSLQMQVDYPSALSGYLMLADGTRYRVQGGKVVWARDRNGNVITYAYTNGVLTQITDPLGRTESFQYHVQVPAGTPCQYNTDAANDGTKCWYDQITYTGVGGAPRTMRVWHSKLDAALRHDYASTSPFNTLFPSYEQDPGETQAYDPADVYTAVELPDGRSYVLRYNDHNELARVVLPTGGATEYDYDTVTSFLNLQRVVRERRVYADASDAAPQVVQTYERSLDTTGSTATVVTVKQKDGASGATLSTEKHYFNGNVVSGQLGFYSPWNYGKEYKTETLAADGVTPLRRVEDTLEARAYPSWYNSGQPQTNGPAFDPRLRQTVTSLLDTSPSLATTQIFYYDADPGLTYNLQNKVEQYGFNSELLRSTETQYQKADAYAGDGWQSPHIRALPLQRSVFDAGHVERARTTYEYDNYTPDPANGNRHAALVPHSDIFGMCTTFDSSGNCSNSSPDAYTTRGNATATTQYLLAGDGSVTGSVTSNGQYDIAGNVVKAVDARGFAATFDFSDNFGSPDSEARTNTVPGELNPPGGAMKSYALPRSATNALGQTVYTQYDYYTGQAVNFEDANGTVTKLSYGVNDPLDRLSQAESAVNVPALHSQKTFTYDDANRTITTTGDLNAYGDNLVKSEAIYDGLGRTTEARQYETSSQYVSKQTQYDALGRASQVSNPFRPTLGETAVWTTSSYDALGRVSSVTTPDGATVYTFYDGVRTMVTDQAGKQRISKADALGRLTDVWEVTASDAATEAVSFPVPQNFPYVPAYGYHTTYGYDVLGNLRKVDQVGQQRYFAYDSLSRLVRAKNPEQDNYTPDATKYPALTDPVTGNAAWSLAYGYDDGGDLTGRKDARGVETTYQYDALGRVTVRGYSDGATPQVNYFYDNQALPAGAPVFTRGKSVGQLVAVTYGDAASAAGSYTGGFDELGRAHYSSQVTSAPDSTGQLVSRTYILGYDYYLDGRLKTETYPSNKVVETQYDSVGRVAGVKDQATGLYYAGGDPSVANNPNVVSYAASGAVTDMRLGNGLWEHASLNSRLQPEHIYLGTAKSSNNVLALDYSYGTTNNNGNVRSQTITAPAYKGDAAFSATQTYSYDPLNRLSSAYELNGSQQETWRQTYSYDRYGNRNLDETQTKKINGANVLAAAIDDTNRATLNPTVSTSTNRISQAGYTFDPAGNLLCDIMHPCAPAPSLTPYFTYDGENHVTKAGGGAQAGGADYSYDGGGQRVLKASGSQVTVFVYDAGGKLVAEYSNQISYNGTSYLTQDTLGSTRVVTNKDGGVVSRHDYQPFGEEINSLALPKTGRESLQSYNFGSVRQKFTAKERDNETGLDYFGARYYSSSQGRFTGIDVVGPDVTNPQTLNKYRYALNNPLRYIDPNGKQEQGESLTDSIRNYFAALVRRLKAQLSPEEVQQEENERPAVATVIDDEFIERYNRLLGERVEFATDVVMFADITGAGTTVRGFLRGNKTEAAIGMAGMVALPLGEIFDVGKSILTSGRLLGGRIGEAEVGAVFAEKGDTFVAGIWGAFNKEGSQAVGNGTIRTLLDSSIDFAKKEGFSKIEVQAIAVINKRLEKILIKQGFTKTKVMVEGELVEAYTKTFILK
jgi:RHS repeat-associated protein